MQFSSTRLTSCVAALRTELSLLSVGSVSGADAASLVSVLAPLRNQVSFAVASLGSSSGQSAQWLASVNGSSEAGARSSLSLVSLVESLPEVPSALEAGSLSVEAGEVIARACDGDADVARSLLAGASGASLDVVRRAAQEVRAQRQSGSERERLRKSQFVSVKSDSDSMVTGSFRFLPEVGARLLRAFQSASGDTPWERAEAFAGLFGAAGGGSSSSGSGSSSSSSSSGAARVVAHVDVTVDGLGRLQLGNRFEIAGIGPVSLGSVTELFESASWSLVGTANNKLVWFSEHDRRSSKAPLPEFIRRAIKARDWDRCSLRGCSRPVVDIDHIQARCNRGVNDPENLQGLCAVHHSEKTRVDAPWTSGGIYAKSAAARQERVRQKMRGSPGDGSAGESGSHGNHGVDGGDGEPGSRSGDGLRSAEATEELFPDTG
jgi:hypothetical protein